MSIRAKLGTGAASASIQGRVRGQKGILHTLPHHDSMGYRKSMQHGKGHGA